MKIGVFDSGIGGITVLKQLVIRFPQAQFVYYGDTAHLPYGSKSPAQIKELSVAGVKALRDSVQGELDAIVVACNTASSYALPSIREEMGKVAVFGVVEPGMKAALDALASMGQGAPLLVLATRGTVRSQAYRRAFDEQSNLSVDVKVFEQACPVLVPMIEEGWIDHPILHASIAEYVKPYTELGPGVALLGCTHYPWIHSAFEKALKGWLVVDSARAVSLALEDAMSGLNLKRGPAKASNLGFKNSNPSSGLDISPSIDWIFTDPQAVPEFAKKLI